MGGVPPCRQRRVLSASARLSAKRLPAVIPQLHRAGHEAALLIQSLRGNVPSLSDHRRPAHTLLPEPGQSRLHQRRAEPASLRFTPHTEQSDPAKPRFILVTGNVTDGASLMNSHKNSLGPSVTAL